MGLCPIVSTTYCSSDAYTYVVVNDGKRGYRLHTWVYGTTLLHYCYNTTYNHVHLAENVHQAED